MHPPPERGAGPPPLSPARVIAAGAIIAVAAALAYYAVGARQEGVRLRDEVARLHEVENALRDSLAAQQARLDALAVPAPYCTPSTTPTMSRSANSMFATETRSLSPCTSFSSSRSSTRNGSSP